MVLHQISRLWKYYPKIIADLTQDQLNNILLLEQVKMNPQDKNIRKEIDLSNAIDRRKENANDLVDH